MKSVREKFLAEFAGAIGGPSGAGLGEPGYEGSYVGNGLPPGWVPDPAAYAGVSADLNPYTGQHDRDPNTGRLYVDPNTGRPYSDVHTNRPLLAFNVTAAQATDATERWVQQTIVVTGQPVPSPDVPPGAQFAGITRVGDRVLARYLIPGGEYWEEISGAPVAPAAQSAPAAQPTGATGLPNPAPAPSGLPRNVRPGPAAPDWTTQTEWRFPKPDPRLLQPITSVDTGSRALNVVLNKVVLPWWNVSNFLRNIPLATVVGIDDAFKHSDFRVEYQNAGDVLAIAPAIEAGPAIEYAGQRLSTWWSQWSTNPRVVNAALAPLAPLFGTLPEDAVGGSALAAEGAGHLKVDLAEQVAVTAEGEWVDYQLYATGTDLEQAFTLTEAGGKVRIVKADALTNSFIVEAKLGNVGQGYNLDRGEFIVNQAAAYLEINEQLGWRGVRYVVSDPLGVERLQKAFALNFPEAVSSGTLSVWWVP